MTEYELIIEEHLLILEELLEAVCWPHTAGVECCSFPQLADYFLQVCDCANVQGQKRKPCIV